MCSIYGYLRYNRSWLTGKNRFTLFSVDYRINTNCLILVMSWSTYWPTSRIYTVDIFLNFRKTVHFKATHTQSHVITNNITPVITCGCDVFLQLLILIFSVLNFRIPQTQRSAQLLLMGRAVLLKWITKVKLLLLWAGPTQLTLEGRKLWAQRKEPGLPRTGLQRKRRMTACSAVCRVASAHRTGTSSNATFPATVTLKMPPCSACSVVPASLRPALWVATVSSRTAYAKTSRIAGAGARRRACRCRTGLPHRPKQETRGRGEWAAECVAGASIKPRTSTHTFAPMAWPSSQHTRQTSPCKERGSGNWEQWV